MIFWLFWLSHSRNFNIKAINLKLSNCPQNDVINSKKNWTLPYNCASVNEIYKKKINKFQPLLFFVLEFRGFGR